MDRVAVRSELGTIVTTGITAGVIFAAFQMLASAIIPGVDGAMAFLRMAGAMVLGPQALEPAYLTPAVLVGAVVHLALSLAFAGIFALLAALVREDTRGELLTTTWGFMIAGMVFGVALWLVNFYLVAPAAGWTWFSTRLDPVAQFLGHAVYFGCPVGLLFGRAYHR